jgi:hypothetical protein
MLTHNVFPQKGVSRSSHRPYLYPGHGNPRFVPSSPLSERNLTSGRIRIPHPAFTSRQDRSPKAKTQTSTQTDSLLTSPKAPCTGGGRLRGCCPKTGESTRTPNPNLRLLNAQRTTRLRNEAGVLCLRMSTT